MNVNSKYPSVYLKSLSISGLKCFKEETVFNLTGSDGNPSRWTIILGNNNSGKTTLLKALSGLETRQNSKREFDAYMPKGVDFNLRDIVNDECYIKSVTTINEGGRQWEYDIAGKNSKEDWSGSYSGSSDPLFENFIIYGYGVGRRSGNNPIEGSNKLDNSATLFGNNESLLNISEWLLKLDIAIKNNAPLAEQRMGLVKKALFTGLLPDISDCRVITDKQFNSFVEFKIKEDWRTLDEIGYGYQTSLAWIADFMKRMFDRYPDSEDPLSEPAILLIDEIDLHLHPAWQRKVINFLTNAFKGTQFIVTTHNPLVVQSAEEVNLIVLKKEGDTVKAENPKFPSFRGWTVEEILSEFMELDSQVMSQAYIETLSSFDKALDDSNYDAAKEAYDKLVKMLHPESAQRKLLRMQLNQIKAA